MSLSTRRSQKQKKSATKPPKKSLLIQNVAKARAFPVLVAFACLGILFVLIRMKGIEQDYKMNEISSLLKKRYQENKELKADKARMLSIKQLELFAKRYDLEEPDEKHIIIIPE